MTVRIHTDPVCEGFPLSFAARPRGPGRGRRGGGFDQTLLTGIRRVGLFCREIDFRPMAATPRTGVFYRCRAAWRSERDEPCNRWTDPARFPASSRRYGARRGRGWRAD